MGGPPVLSDHHDPTFGLIDLYPVSGRPPLGDVDHLLQLELPFGYYHQIVGESVAYVTKVKLSHQVIDIQCKKGGTEDGTLWDSYIHVDDIVPDLGPGFVQHGVDCLGERGRDPLGQKFRN